MNILIITSVNYKQNGGILTQQNILIEILKNNGFEVELFILNKGKNKLYDFYLPFKPRDLYFKKKYEIVLLNDPHVGRLTWFTLLNKIKNKKKIYLFSHGWIFHDSQSIFRKIVFKMLSKIALSSIDKIFCVSPEDLQAVNFASNARLLWNPVVKIFDGLLNELSFNGEFVFIGMNNENKNLKKLILVFSHESMKLFKLHIIGSGTEQLKTLSKNVKIHGEITDEKIDNILKKSSYYISLSKYEGFGISIVEAMSYGLQAFLSNNVAHKYHIHQSKSGIILDYEINSMVDQINNFVAKKNEVPIESLINYASKYSVDVFQHELLHELRKT
jgi:glycosyltransferase involved in cell wall biosynthesis